MRKEIAQYGVRKEIAPQSVRKEIAQHGVRKEIAPHCVLPQSPPAFVIRAFALLTHAGLAVCTSDNTFGAKKNSCLLFLRDRSETSAVPLLLLLKNSLSIPSFFKYEKLTGNTLTGVNRTSLLGTLSVVSSGRIVCNAVSAAFHQPAAL